jgi:hypothetical protein
MVMLVTKTELLVSDSSVSADSGRLKNKLFYCPIYKSTIADVMVFSLFKTGWSVILLSATGTHCMGCQYGRG